MMLFNMTHDEIRKLLLLEVKDIQKRHERSFSAIRRQLKSPPFIEIF